jgi:hypothetical protein
MKQSHSVHQYYDISYFNNGNTKTLAQLFDNRSTPIIENPNNYYLSIVRFIIPTSYIPIAIYPSVNGVADNTKYSVTLNNTQIFLTYVPASNLTLTDPDYFFIYSFQQFIDMVNVALASAYTIVGGPANSPPYMVYDAQTALFSIIAEADYDDTLNYQLYFNFNLFALFDNFLSIRNGNGTTLGKDVQIIIKNTGNNSVEAHPEGYAPPLSKNGWQMSGEYVSTYLFNSVRSLVFISNTLPVANEALNVQNTSTITTGNTNRKILTDFEFNIESGLSNNTIRSYVQYIPFGEYRLIDLKSNSPIYCFDTQIYFQTKDLNIYPLYINPNESISMKVLFRSKSF